MAGIVNSPFSKLAVRSVTLLFSGTDVYAVEVMANWQSAYPEDVTVSFNSMTRSLPKTACV